MCGIAGIVIKNNNLSVKDTLFSMSQAIKHRGPDGEGFVFFGEQEVAPAFSDETPLVNTQSSTFLYNPKVRISNVGNNYKLALAHRRLSIIDISEAGHQPMCDKTGNYWVTFNGEIYNYIELKKELEDKGHTFITKTDTEVLIESYKEWGVDCLLKFNGMFAFVLFDKKTNQLFCARDRVGVKPFYYVNTDSVFAFASEQKAFLKSGLITFDINEKEQFDFIINANLETKEQSLYKGIFELKPSHYLLYTLLDTTIKQTVYYTLPKQSTIVLTEAECINNIERKLVNAIKLRLRSDVEIGSCLSGGLDSSIMAGIIKNLQPQSSLKLFTAIFPNQLFNEESYAKLVADYVGGQWKTVMPTADDFFKDIEVLNYYQDLPVWSTSTYSQHRVMKLAHENGVKVVLDGQGADELFAGYTHHYMALWKENIGFKTLNRITESKLTINKPYRLFIKQLLKDGFGLSVDYSLYFITDKKQFIKSNNEPLANSLNQQLALDYNGKLKSFLKCEDRCSMAFGIESRVPFADDTPLVDYAFSLPGNQKIKKGISKYLLREATKQYMPQKIYLRKDKVGFEAPVAEWLSPYKKHVIDTITNELDFIKSDILAKRYEWLLVNKPIFLLRVYSFAIWKKINKK